MSSGPPTPQQSVERYAAMAAALRQPFAERNEILGGAGVTEEEWRRIEAHWRERLPNDGDVASHYQAAFKKANESLRQGKAPRDVAKDVRAPVAPQVEEAPVLPAAAPLAMNPVVMHQPSVLDTTAAPLARHDSPIPFAGRVDAPPPGADHTLSGDQSGQTAELRAEHLFGATPFEDEHGSLDGTQAVTALVSDEDALPFQSTAPMAPPTADMAPHEAVGATAFVSALDVKEAALPFSSDERSSHRFHAAPLTIAQLAAAYVELQHGSREEVLARYQLTEELYRALDAERRALPVERPELAGAWDEACKQYWRWRATQEQG